LAFCLWLSHESAVFAAMQHRLCDEISKIRIKTRLLASLQNLLHDNTSMPNFINFERSNYAHEKYS